MAPNRKDGVDAPAAQRQSVKDVGPNPIDVHVGARIRLRRNLIGVTQQDLGKALGLTFQQVQKYERGMNRVGASRLFDIGQILNVPIQYFFENISESVAERSPRRMQGVSEPATPDYAADPMSDKDTRDLVKAFQNISDSVRRRKLIELCRAMSDQPDDNTDVR